MFISKSKLSEIKIELENLKEKVLIQDKIIYTLARYLKLDINEEYSDRGDFRKVTITEIPKPCSKYGK